MTNTNNMLVPKSGVFYTLDKDVMIDVVDDRFKFLLEKEKYLGEYIALKTQGIDVHVMNKYSLLRLIDDGK